MIKKFTTLVSYIDAPTAEKMRVFQNGNNVYIELLEAPIKKIVEEFESFYEAKAFVRGVKYMAQIQGGSISNRMETVTMAMNAK